MSPALRVIQPGLLATLQDLGRTGYQRLGIPVSGALDPIALRAANAIVGNAQDTAGLEVAVLGPVLEVEAVAVRIALAGHDVKLQVRQAAGQSVEVPALQSHRLVRGDRLRFLGLDRSAAAYLGVEGGFAVPPFLGSLSTYVRGGFGGFDGRNIGQGDRLPLTLDEAPERDEASLETLALRPASDVRVVLGPQDDYFTAEALAAFLAGPYTVSREADRMGLRLEGPTLVHAKGYNIASDGIAPGSIQVPGSGQPIVLLADRQTTGGYPKIATVISADLPALGRVLPGMTLRFRAIGVGEAQAARRGLENQLRDLRGSLVPVRPTGPDLSRLYETNLISGIVDAHDMEPTTDGLANS